jgi:RNA polymerase sigma-70 factor (ECF subfamily)
VRRRSGPSAGDEIDDLVRLAAQGDGPAFSALIQRHDRQLRALSYHVLGDREAMDDVLQDAYLKAFRALPEFRGESALGTWLYRVVYNACLDELRRSKHRERVLSLSEAPERHRPPPGDPREQVEHASVVRDALKALSPEERAAVWLVDAVGLSYHVAAEALGIREGTLASRLNRARAALRERLADLVGQGASR